MSTALPTLPAPLDAGLGGVLLANMLEAWLASDPHFFTAAEVADELKDCRTAPEQTCLHLSASVDAGPSAPPSGEYRASVRVAGDGAAVGMELDRDSHPRPGPGEDGYGDDQARGLQDLGSGCFDGASGRGVCFGSLATGTLELGLALTVGAMCPHPDARHRRRWLLRSSRFQRQSGARIEGHHGAGRTPFPARAPPRR